MSIEAGFAFGIKFRSNTRFCEQKHESQTTWSDDKQGGKPTLQMQRLEPWNKTTTPQPKQLARPVALSEIFLTTLKSLEIANRASAEVVRCRVLEIRGGYMPSHIYRTDSD